MLEKSRQDYENHVQMCRTQQNSKLPSNLDLLDKFKSFYGLFNPLYDKCKLRSNLNKKKNFFDNALVLYLDNINQILCKIYDGQLDAILDVPKNWKMHNRKINYIFNDIINSPNKSKQLLSIVAKAKELLHDYSRIRELS